MNRLIYAFVVLLLIVAISGCTAYDATKTGITDVYNGGKTFISNSFSGLGNLIGGEKSVKFSIEFGSGEKDVEMSTDDTTT